MAADGDLVARAQEGVVEAQAELFRRHAPRVTSLLTRLLGSRSDAEDATQDTFVLAFRDLGDLQAPGAFGGWLTGIAVHQAHRHFRRRRLLGLLGLDRSEPDAPLDQLADLNAPPELRAELALVARLLDRLPTAERIAWMLRHVEGYELADVAHSCGCSLATAKRRIAAAQARLAAKVHFEEAPHA